MQQDICKVKYNIFLQNVEGQMYKAAENGNTKAQDVSMFTLSHSNTGFKQLWKKSSYS